MSYFRSYVPSPSHEAPRAGRNTRNRRYAVGDMVTVYWDGHPIGVYTVKAIRRMPLDDTLEYQLATSDGEDYEQGAWVKEEYLLEEE